MVVAGANARCIRNMFGWDELFKRFEAQQIYWDLIQRERETERGEFPTGLETNCGWTIFGKLFLISCSTIFHFNGRITWTFRQEDNKLFSNHLKRYVSLSNLLYILLTNYIRATCNTISIRIQYGVYFRKWQELFFLEMVTSQKLVNYTKFEVIIDDIGLSSSQRTAWSFILDFFHLFLFVLKNTLPINYLTQSGTTIVYIVVAHAKKKHKLI